MACMCELWSADPARRDYSAATPNTVSGAAGSAGASNQLSRGDHQHVHASIASGNLHPEYAQLAGAVFTGAITTAGTKIAVAAKTGAYTLGATDEYVRADAGGGAFTVTLPAATGSGRVYKVKRLNSGNNVVSVGKTGSDTIDGAASFDLLVQYEVREFIDAAAGAWDVA